MSRSDVKKMIDEVDENKDGRLDYGEVIRLLLVTYYRPLKFNFMNLRCNCFLF